MTVLGGGHVELGQMAGPAAGPTPTGPLASPCRVVPLSSCITSKSPSFPGSAPENCTLINERQ